MEKWAKIVRFLANNANSKEDAVDIFDISFSLCQKACSVISACKHNDTEQLLKYRRNNATLVDVACKHFAIQLKEPKPQPAPVPAAQPVQQAAPMADSEVKVYLAQMAKGINEQNELLRDLIDVVIPTYIKDLTDAIDAAVHDTGDLTVKAANNIITAVNTDTDLLFQQSAKMLLALNKRK